VGSYGTRGAKESRYVFNELEGLQRTFVNKMRMEAGKLATFFPL
jgi:hypothetical protein